MSGNVGVPVYITLTAKTTKHTLEHSEAKVCVIGKLTKGILEGMHTVEQDGLKGISFPLCPVDLTY